MSQSLSNHLRRSLAYPTPKPSEKYRISKRNNSMFQQKHKHRQTIPHSDIEQLCKVKNYQDLNENSIKHENRKLKLVLRQLNDSLTYRVERKKLRVETNNSTSISMRELMEYIPKDFDQEEKKNGEMIEELRRELETSIKKKRAIEDISYRNRLEQETSRVNKMSKEIEESIREIKRMFILKEKEIRAQEKYNEGSELYVLRTELMKVNKGIEDIENRLEETEVENNRIYEKILIVSNKSEAMQEEYQGVVNANQQDSNRLLEINHSNEVYLEHLNRLKNSKRRFNTSNQIYKVKYYNALKKLDLQAERVNKVEAEVKELEYQIYLKKELGERMALRLEEAEQKNRIYFQEVDRRSGFMITELDHGKKTHQSRKSYSQHSQSVKSSKLAASEEDRCESIFQ